MSVYELCQQNFTATQQVAAATRRATLSRATQLLSQTFKTTKCLQELTTTTKSVKPSGTVVSTLRSKKVDLSATADFSATKRLTRTQSNRTADVQPTTSPCEPTPPAVVKAAPTKRLRETTKQPPVDLSATQVITSTRPTRATRRTSISPVKPAAKRARRDSIKPTVPSPAHIDNIDAVSASHISPVKPVVAKKSRSKPLSPLVQLELMHDALHLSAQPVYSVGQQTQCIGLLGREYEYSQIKRFITQSIDTKKSNSIYICGSPGTGKTATIDCIMSTVLGVQIDRQNNVCSRDTTQKCAYNNVQVVYINAMTLKNNEIKSIYQRIYTQLSGMACSIEQGYQMLEQYVTSSKQAVVCVIDEVDNLIADTKTVLNNALQQLYSLSSKQSSKLVLIGLSNNIQLPTYMKQMNNKAIQTMVFTAYNNIQLVDIVTQRLRQAVSYESDDNTVPFFDAMSIQFLCKRIGASTGDIRRCLDICRQCVGQLIVQYKDNDSCTAVVSMPMMSQTLNASSSNARDEVNGISALPTQQQLMLSCAVIYQHTVNSANHRSKKIQQCSMAGMRQFYTQLCAAHKMPYLQNSEYDSCLQLLCGSSYITIAPRSRAPADKSVAIQVSIDVRTMRDALETKNKLLLYLLNKALRRVDLNAAEKDQENVPQYEEDE